MKKSRLMQKVEAKYEGKSLEEIIAPMLVDWGPSATADEIGVSKATLGSWVTRLNWRVVRTILRPDETIQIVKDLNYRPSSPLPMYTTAPAIIENTHLEHMRNQAGN